MRVLGISGSPRRGGNTDLLLAEVLRGAESRGALVKTIVLSELNIAPCEHRDDCLVAGNCSIQDDMQQVYRELERADRLVLASPLHFGLLGSKREAWMKSGRFADLNPKLEKVEALLEDEPGDIPDLGLRYLLSDPQVSMILTGAANTTELETSTAVSDGRNLSPELIARINAIPS